MHVARTDRTVVITGANSGIGRAAAVRFAADGYRVVMACRNVEKSQQALREIIDASGSSSVELIRLDVSSFESIRSFCSAFRNEHDRLDVLIHNAGYFEHGIRTYQFSADGIELTFATNIFGPLLLTELLLDPLAKSDDPRVLFASSTSLKYFFDPKRRIEFDNLRGEHRGSRPYSVFRMYGDSKMGVLLLASRMAAEYARLGIKVNAIMIPATRVAKETLRKMHGRYRLIGSLVQNLNPWALEPEQIAASYHHICTSEAFRPVTGALVDSNNEVLPPMESGRRLDPVTLPVTRPSSTTRRTSRVDARPPVKRLPRHVGNASPVYPCGPTARSPDPRSSRAAHARLTSRPRAVTLALCKS